MSFERPDNCTIVFLCDGCDEVAEFSSDGKKIPMFDMEGKPAYGACWTVIEAEGWITQKRIGKTWEHFCDTCAPAAEREAQKRAFQEQQRERLKSKNAE